MRSNKKRYPAADLAEAAIEALVRDRLGSFVVVVTTRPGRPPVLFILR
jgi:hypothetical protein